MAEKKTTIDKEKEALLQEQENLKKELNKLKVELFQKEKTRAEEEAKVAKDKAKKETADENDNVIVELYGFQIKANSLYEIQEKFDADAPDGFQKEGTSKLLSFDVVDKKSGAVWDGTMNNWDNGLHSGSKSLQEAFPGQDIQLILDKLIKKILKPVEALVGEGKLSHIPSDVTNKYWDEYRIEFKRGKIFNTANPTSLLDLYLSVLHKRLTPKDLENEPGFRNSYYLITDKETAISKKAKSKEDKMKATANFFFMLKNDKNSLLQILEFIGLPVGQQTEDSTLMVMFENWLENGVDKYQNPQIFNKETDAFATEEGKEKLFIYGKLKEFKAKNLVTEKRGDVYLDGTYISNNGLKQAAAAICEQKELYNIFTEYL